MKKKSKAISLKLNYIYNLSYQIVALILPIITTPYISRVLQADGIGQYSYALSIVAYFTMFGNLGIATYGQLQIAMERDNKEKISTLFCEIVVARFFTMSICALVYFVVAGSVPGNKTIAYIVALDMLASAIDITWFFQGLEQFKKTVIRNYMIKIISLILIFTMVRQKTDLYKYILILQGSTLIGNCSLWFYLKQYIYFVPMRKLKFWTHWKSSFVYFIPTIATSVYTVLDKSMLGWFTTASFENGYYEQAHKIEQIAVVVVTSLSAVTLPRMAYLFKENETDEIKQKLQQSIRFILMISLPMTIGLIAVADQLIPAFLGKGYEKCILLTQIFSLLIIAIGLNNAVGMQCLMPQGKQKEFNIGVIIGAIVNFIANMILIPRFYSIGAAIASVLSEVIILFVFIFFSRDYISLKKLIRSGIPYLGSALAMFLILFGMKCIEVNVIVSLFVEILAGVLIYFGILILIRDEMVQEAFVLLKHKLHRK